MKKAFLALIALSLSGCAYPNSAIEQGLQTGHLRFTSAPAGALISIDGQDRSAVSAKGPTLIDVPPGKHNVVETVDGRVVLHRDYEVGAGATIEL